MEESKNLPNSNSKKNAYASPQKSGLRNRSSSSNKKAPKKAMNLGMRLPHYQINMNTHPFVAIDQAITRAGKFKFIDFVAQ